jgi:glutamate 5-kinase
VLNGASALLDWPTMTLVVKLGSSVVVDDGGELRKQVLASICQQVAHLVQEREQVVLVTSGAIARGTNLLGARRRPKKMDELQAASAIGQADIFRAYANRLSRRDVKSAQILLSRSDIENPANYRNIQHTIERLLKWGIVPIVNENDTTATDEITFGDNDFLAAQLAVLLHARSLVLLTNTDGLFDTDPRRDKNARLIEEVADFGQLAEVEIGAAPSQLGRGGMGSKIAAAEMAANSGVGVVISNGRAPHVVRDVAAGRRVGTSFPPARRREKTSVFKLWLKYGTRPVGSLFVDAGAERALRQAGSSLLPVGVVRSSKTFAAGDVVEVRSEATDEVIGRGVTEVSSERRNQALGRGAGGGHPSRPLRAALAPTQ